MDVDSFSHGQDARSKSPAPAHGRAAHRWAASAKRGGLLFWLLFSWPRKRNVTRAPKAHESSALNNKSIAHRVRSYTEQRKREAGSAQSQRP
jgi:hypothetical protein